MAARHPIPGRPGSARLAELMLVVATRGAADIVFRAYDAPATRTNLPAAVQLVVFEVRAGAQEMFLGILDIASCLDTGQRKVNTFGRVVRTWRLLVLHRRPASCVPSPSWAPPDPGRAANTTFTAKHDAGRAALPHPAWMGYASRTASAPGGADWLGRLFIRRGRRAADFFQADQVERKILDLVQQAVQFGVIPDGEEDSRPPMAGFHRGFAEQLCRQRPALAAQDEVIRDDSQPLPCRVIDVHRWQVPDLVLARLAGYRRRLRSRR